MLKALRALLLCLASARGAIRCAFACIHSADKTGLSTSPQAGQIDAERIRIVAAMIEQAQARIELLSQQVDGDDIKALGLITANIATLGVLFVLQPSLNVLWWLPAFGFIVSSISLYVALLPRKFGLGPDIQEFYDEWGGGTEIEVSSKLLAVLIKTIKEDEELINGKRPWLRRGRLALIPTLTACLLFSVLPRVTTGTHVTRHRIAPHSTAISQTPAPHSRHLHTQRTK